MHVDEKTHIPLFAVLASLPFILGIILWLTSIDSKATETKNQMNELRPMVQDILTRVIRIEEHQKHK